MIAVDTNILVYAHRKDSSFHDVAFRRVAELSEGHRTWAIPWPCVHEFHAIVTHPRIYVPPSTAAQAIAQLDAWMQSPSLVMIGETSHYWRDLRQVLTNRKVVGPKVHDARIAAICMAHRVTELWSADRDFKNLGKLRLHNPLK